MLYNHEQVFVYMLLIPVVLNICVPLVMLIGWLFKQVLWGMLRQSNKEAVVDQNQISAVT